MEQIKCVVGVMQMQGDTISNYYQQNSNIL